MDMSERIVFLLDMDAFFASVEERENPDLKGKPVMVVGSASARSVVCAANYEIRKFGVHSAMPYTQAVRLCPHAEIIVAHPDIYRTVSRSVFAICETFTDLLEISSIDECYMDVTPTAAMFGGPIETAKRLKAKIREAEGITCSVGIGPNKLVAKLATGMRKPDGLFWIKTAEIPEIFATIPISKLHGIGEKTADKLRSMGLTTAASLGQADRATMQRVFGSSGDRLVDMGLGVVDSPIVPYYVQPLPKSVSHEHTLGENTRDLEILKRTLHYLAERVAYRLRKQGLSAKTVGLTLRFHNLQRITRAKTLSDATDDGLELYNAILPLLVEAMHDPRPIRLIGVSTGNLQNGGNQCGLFDDPRRKHLTSVVDSLNERFGKSAVKPASLTGKQERDHITFRG
jgi:DNA polymerase IV